MEGPGATVRGNVYAELLRVPGMWQLAVPGLIGRLVPAMVGLSVLLLVREQAGGFGVAGLATGAIALGGAAAAPFVGRVVDAVGARRTLPWFSLGYVVACGSLLGVAYGHAPAGWIVAVCVFVGLFTPPVSPFLRTMWIRVTDDERLQHAGSSLEAALVEVAFLIGPVAAAAMITSAGPGVALAVVAGAGLVGGVGVGRARVVRSLPVRADPIPGHTAGRIPRLPVGLLLGVVALITLGFGAIDVAVPAAAAHHGDGAYTGLLLAVWALGSLIAAVVSGRRHRPGRPLRTQIATSVGSLAVFSLLLPFAPDLLVLGVALLLAGLGVAPSFVVCFRLGAELAPAGRMTEVSSILSSAIYGGSAIGTAVAGQVVSHVGTHVALAMAPAAAAVACVLALLLRRVTAPVRST